MVPPIPMRVRLVNFVSSAGDDGDDAAVAVRVLLIVCSGRRNDEIMLLLAVTRKADNRDMVRLIQTIFFISKDIFLCAVVLISIVI